MVTGTNPNFSVLKNLLNRRRNSDHDSSSEEEDLEDEIGDMGLFGSRLEQFHSTHPHFGRNGGPRR